MHRAGVANDLYQQALQRQTEAPSILNFAVPTSVGLDHMCQIHPEQMNLRNGQFIAPAMMDLAFRWGAPRHPIMIY